MNKHSWAGWADDPETISRLWAARSRLKTAWEADQEDPAHYPINTSWALAEIEEAVGKKSPNRSAKSVRKQRPETLADLVPEREVSALWEEYNRGTFKDAIGRAATIDCHNTKNIWKIFQTIIRAIEAAYLARFLGPEFLSKPKVNILHTGLDQIAKAAALGDQTEKGFAEFLDDLCPCGLKDHREAVRKLAKRSMRMRRPHGLK